MAGTKHPEIFISYSWDNEEFDESILQLGAYLQQEGSCKVTVDKVCQIEIANKGLAQFMLDHITGSDFVLIVWSESYLRKATSKDGTGLGVKFETFLINNSLYLAGGHNQKFIPIIMEEFEYSKPEHILPLFRGSLYYCIPRQKSDLLYRIYGHEQIVLPPPAAAPPFLAKRVVQPWGKQGAKPAAARARAAPVVMKMTSNQYIPPKDYYEDVEDK